jgi:hypothetical protein
VVADRGAGAPAQALGVPGRDGAPGLWLWYASGLYRDYGNTFGVLSGGDDEFGDIGYWTSIDFYAGNLRTELLFVYGVVALALIGVWRARGTVRPLLVAGFAALVVYYVAVARYSGSDMGIQYHVYSLPYAALLTGLGLDAVLGRVRERWRTAAAAPAVLLLGAQSINVFVGSLPDRGGTFRVCTHQHRPAALQALRDRGADFYVVPAPAPGDLDGWPAANALQVRSAARDGCDTWDLRPR